MKKKVVVIHQPDFAPYLGFFHRFLHADLYIALDHVQFVNSSSRSWTNRDKIKTVQGESWLTVGVRKSPRVTPLKLIELSTTTSWKQDNIRLFEQNYRKAQYYYELMPEIEKLYGRSFRLLRDFNMASIEMLMNLLNVRIPWEWSSNLSPEGSKNELLVDILKKVSATHYLSGMGAKNYFDPKPFEDSGIDVIWQNFRHPIYPQQFGDFVPYLSTLDMLFNCGIKKSREILRNYA
jgi:hypothetical protein